MQKHLAGLTLMEVLMVLAALMILAALMLPGFLWPRRVGRSPRIQCVNNLNQVALSARVWEDDNRYPMAVYATNGGAYEFTHHTQQSAIPLAPTQIGTSPYQGRVFQVMSNELSTPKVLICPADSFHTLAATNFGTAGQGFGDFDLRKVSFFIGDDAVESDPQMVLFGDQNIGIQAKAGPDAPGATRFTSAMVVTTGAIGWNASAGWAWTVDTHNKVGNLALADGSVQQVSITGLKNAMQNGTNTVVWPVYEFWNY
jgi:hypothetical protein